MTKCACWPKCENMAEELKIEDGTNISPGMDEYCNDPCTWERHDIELH